jgi:hypothetical protein
VFRLPAGLPVIAVTEQVLADGLADAGTAAPALLPRQRMGGRSTEGGIDQIFEA